MSSEFGKRLKVTVFGQSHGTGIGCVVDGLPAGEEIDIEELALFMERRKGGKGKLTTARREADAPEFISGLKDGKTCASPLCAVIRNGDQHSKDYASLLDTPRPGHADFTAYMKWNGMADMRGGGHFSGRLTAPLCVAGGIAKQILARKGIFIGAHAYEVAGIRDEAFPLLPSKELFEEIARKPIPAIDDKAAEGMKSAIEDAREHLDSMGGIVECAIIGVPAGLGDPMFDGAENNLARALFGIPAVKGVEFGDGFESARRMGSENNDAFYAKADGGVFTRTNHAGGILGGITNGMPIVVRAAFKPTPSIARKQETIRLSTGANEELEITGRHDPCIALRAVPVVEAVSALVILDMLLEGK